MAELLIKGGMVIDGTGNAGYEADVFVKDGKIAKIAKIAKNEKTETGPSDFAAADIQVLDARGKLVTPGFINMHSHSDCSVAMYPEMESTLGQGITTEFAGHCGLGVAPVDQYWLYMFPEKRAFSRVIPEPIGGINPYDAYVVPTDCLRKPFEEVYGEKLDWSAYGEFIDHMRKRGMGANLVLVAGHAQMRLQAMGLDYIYVNDGNDVQALIEAFSKVKDIQHPIVVHINTLKGKGYAHAEQDKETYHWRTPFNPETGEAKVSYEEEDYSEVTAQYLLKKMKEDSRVVTITSGTPAVLGFTPDRRQEAGKQFVDVGIAEEHAVALASGIAANGGKPVYGVYSTFIQRSYDQLSQDLCINNNPAVLLVFWGTLSGMNDVTHLCFFDIPLISNIPNMVYLAPTCKEEYLAMLEWSICQNEHPVAIRVPATDVISCGEPVESDYSNLNRYKVAHRGSKVAILALGSFFGLGQSVLSLLKDKANIDATLINPRYITGVDSELMDELKADHELVITLEDGVLDGGFGEKIARYYGATDMKVLNYGAKKEFVDRYDIQELLRANHLTDEQIVEDILSLIG